MLHDHNGDLSLEAYALIILLIIGYEFLGLATVLYVALSLAGLLLVALLTAALVKRLRDDPAGENALQRREDAAPRKWVGSPQ